MTNTLYRTHTRDEIMRMVTADSTELERALCELLEDSEEECAELRKEIENK